MISRAVAAALIALAPIGALIGGPGGMAAAAACPEPSPTLMFHSCWQGGRLGVMLLPEDLPLPQGGLRVIVTGVYTSTETRGEGLRKPVGLFIHRGAVVNPNLGRMDGILISDPTSGTPELWNRRQVRLGSESFDLTDLDQRRAFTDTAREAGLSVLQSHLLIVDGTVDVRRQEDAPVFFRRILFTDAEGFGIYQSTLPLTLYEAATELDDSLGPDMALNLDMGSYDFCLRLAPEGDSQCGFLDRETIQKLSNLLVISAGG